MHRVLSCALSLALLCACGRDIPLASTTRPEDEQASKPIEQTRGSSNAPVTSSKTAPNVANACPVEGCPGCDPGTDEPCTLSNGCAGVKTCIGTRYGACHCAGGGGTGGSCTTTCGVQGGYVCDGACNRTTTCIAAEICNGCDENGNGQIDENNVCNAGCMP